MKTRSLAAVLAAGVAIVSSGAWAVPDPFFGAIFTTTVDGTTVDANLYDSKDAVYLNGGPQNDHAQGMPDGTYYFEVTDPSGATLLSTDPAECRQLVVTGGKVAGVTGPCPHATGVANTANGSLPVQLAPYNDTPNPGGEYKAWLIKHDAATVGTDGIALSFSTSDSKTDNFKVRQQVVVDYSISGEKYYDANVNGQLDSGEAGIQGWKIELSGSSLSNTTSVFTATAGQYSFLVDAGTYAVCEVMPTAAPKWINTGPTSVGGLEVPPSHADVNFGNVCVGAGNGFTLGFWSNPNGKTILGAHDPAWRALLSGLNLRSANGAAYDIAATGSFNNAYNGFRTWILNATATNMAYMLSAQLATMELNVAYGGNIGGPVSAGAFVYAGSAPAGCTVPGLQANGFITIGNLMAAADNASNYSLAGYSVTKALGVARSCQEFMKTTLDNANNNRNFVQAAACEVNYTGTEPSCSH